MTEQERHAIIQRAFQQAATAVQSQGIAAREIKEYLREAYGFGTVRKPPQEQKR